MASGTCSNQYDCQTAKSASTFIADLASHLLGYLLRPKYQRKIFRKYRFYLKAIGLADYEFWIWQTLLIYIYLCAFKAICKYLYQLVQPKIDVEADTEPFQEPVDDCSDEYYNRCSICLQSYNKKYRIAFLKSCIHVFHRRCIEQWYQQSYGECPLCRSTFQCYYIHNEVVRNPLRRQMICNSAAKVRWLARKARPEVEHGPEFAHFIRQLMQEIVAARERRLEAEQETDDGDYDWDEEEEESFIEYELEEDDY